jgi:hypothetical protein
MEQHTIVSVIIGIGVHALGGSARPDCEERHRMPVRNAVRDGARRILVANIIINDVVLGHNFLWLGDAI